MNIGKFITLEGTEGAGKSTALQFIHTYLINHQIDVLLTREPGGTAIAEEIRKMILHPAHSETMYPETELLLLFAGRAQHIQQCLKPTLQSGKWVISYRYIDASYAYQGGGRNIAEQSIKILDKLVVGSFYPNLTFLLDISAEEGIARTEQRGSQKDRIEQEQIDFFKRVRQVYLERAAQDPKRIKVIDASQSLTQVQENIKCLLDKLIMSA